MINTIISIGLFGLGLYVLFIIVCFSAIIILQWWKHIIVTMMLISAIGVVSARVFGVL